jgi:hypothetical protein
MTLAVVVACCRSCHLNNAMAQTKSEKVRSLCARGRTLDTGADISRGVMSVSANSAHVGRRINSDRYMCNTKWLPRLLQE